MLCVSFSSKSKAINVFPKHIKSSKEEINLLRGSKELFQQCFAKVFDQNQKHAEARNQRTGTQAGFTVLC